MEYNWIMPKHKSVHYHVLCDSCSPSVLWTVWLCAGQSIQKDTARDSIKSFAEIQNHHIHWLPLVN